MNKLIAIVNVVAWSGFWAFGYIALTSEGLSARQLTVAALLACAGLVTGVAAYLRLARAAEESGYARRSRQLDAETRNRAHQQGGV